MIFKFISWHYSEGIKKYFLILRNFIEYFWRHFSVGPLFMTLFSPWRRDITLVKEKGFHPVLWMQSFVMNFFARIMGGIVKSAVILFSLLLELLVFIFGMVFFLVWIFFPVFFIA